MCTLCIKDQVYFNLMFFLKPFYCLFNCVQLLAMHSCVFKCGNERDINGSKCECLRQFLGFEMRVWEMSGLALF